MDSSQNFANHTRLVPLYHVFTLGLALVSLIGSIVNLVKSIGAGSGEYSASLIVALAVTLLLTALFARTFALKVQDRVIRSEENMRHYLRTGKMLDTRLTLRQIIALRFASDEEFDALATRAIEEGLSEKEIKQAVKSWRGDYVRA